MTQRHTGSVFDDRRITGTTRTDRRAERLDNSLTADELIKLDTVSGTSGQEGAGRAALGSRARDDQGTLGTDEGLVMNDSINDDEIVDGYFDSTDENRLDADLDVKPLEQVEPGVLNGSPLEDLPIAGKYGLYMGDDTQPADLVSSDREPLVGHEEHIREAGLHLPKNTEYPNHTRRITGDEGRT